MVDGQGTGRAGAIAQRDRPDPGPAWLPLVPALVTLLVGLYKITGPSFTRDESATLAAVHRSFPQLVSMLGHVNVVHGAYYALIWVVVRIGGSGEFAVRLPSAIAMAVAAAMVTLLGRRLVSSWAGLAAGLTFAFLPQVSWFAENAREGAVLTALACVASYCLLRALQQDTARGRWLAGYGVTLVALGLTNLFGLLLVVAHAVTLAWSRREYRVGRGFVLRWAAAVAATVILVSPVAVVGYGQLRQIHWIKPPSLYALLSVERLIGDTVPFLIVLVIVACAVVVSTGVVSTGRAGPNGSLVAQHRPPARAGQPGADRPRWAATGRRAAQAGPAVAAPAAGHPADRLTDPPGLHLPLHRLLHPGRRAAHRGGSGRARPVRGAGGARRDRAGRAAQPAGRAPRGRARRQYPPR